MPFPVFARVCKLRRRSGLTWARTGIRGHSFFRPHVHAAFTHTFCYFRYPSSSPICHVPVVYGSVGGGGGGRAKTPFSEDSALTSSSFGFDLVSQGTLRNSRKRRVYKYVCVCVLKCWGLSRQGWFYQHHVASSTSV